MLLAMRAAVPLIGVAIAIVPGGGLWRRRPADGKQVTILDSETDNYLLGTSKAEVIAAGGGNDTIDGLGGRAKAFNFASRRSRQPALGRERDRLAI